MATNSLHRFLLLALLGACTDPYNPPAPPVATVSGVVEIDNAIQNATVFVDFNNDNLLDSNEPSVATDATGHYTLTWENYHAPHSIGAIVSPTSTRAGVIAGHDAAVGFSLHMRAPLTGDTTESFERTGVALSPLTTLVVSEMAADPTLTEDTAKAKLAGALSASQLPWSGQPLDVMADYSTDHAAGTDNAQLRYTAGVVATIVSNAVEQCNAAQSHIDCNDAMFFDPAIVAMDTQLTTIANGTHKFLQLTSAQQADVVANPSSYHGYFVDTAALSEEIENELFALALDLAAELFDYIKEEFTASLEAASTELAADLLSEMIEALI